MMVVVSANNGDVLAVTKGWYLRFFADLNDFSAGAKPPSSWLIQSDEIWRSTGWTEVRRIHDEHVPEESA
jgi:hypothetical protein